jgi:hypothetical protein
MRLSFVPGCVCHDELESFVESAAVEHDPTAATLADQTDINPHAHNFPIGAAAGVGLTEADDIAQVDLNKHGGRVWVE